jgi:hypothetical protein
MVEGEKITHKEGFLKKMREMFYKSLEIKPNR